MDSETTTGKKLSKRTKAQIHLPQNDLENEIGGPISDDRDLTEIICLTSYPPRECGIATYSKDLEKALTDKFGGAIKLKVYPLESGISKHHYPEIAAQTLNTDSALDFLQAAY